MKFNEYKNRREREDMKYEYKFIVKEKDIDLYKQVLQLRYNEFFGKLGLEEKILQDEYEENAIHLICIHKNELIGYCRLNKEENIGIFSQFVVQAGYRRRGIGKKLMDIIEQKALSLNINLIKMSAKIESINFYKRLGYVEEGEIFSSSKTGLPHQSLIKCIKKIGVAIIGTGFGGLVHLPAYMLSPYYEVIGIYGKNYKKTQKISLEYKIKPYRTLDEIIEDLDVLLVSISSIVSEHFTDCQRLMKFKKYIILEKPMALNGFEAESLGKLADRYRNRTAIVYEHIYDPAWRMVKKIVDCNMYGNIHSMYFDYSFTYWNSKNSARGFGWFSEKEKGGGIKGGHLSHVIRIVDFLTNGNIASICGKSYVEIPCRYDANGELCEQTAEDTVTALIELTGKIPVFVNISATRTETYKRVNVYTENSRIEIRGPREICIYDLDNKIIETLIDDEFLTEDYGGDFRINSFVEFIKDYYSKYLLDSKDNYVVNFSEGCALQKLLDKVD